MLSDLEVVSVKIIRRQIRSFGYNKPSEEQNPSKYISIYKVSIMPQDDGDTR